MNYPNYSLPALIYTGNDFLVHIIKTSGKPMDQIHHKNKTWYLKEQKRNFLQHSSKNSTDPSVTAIWTSLKHLNTRWGSDPESVPRLPWNLKTFHFSVLLPNNESSTELQNWTQLKQLDPLKTPLADQSALTATGTPSSIIFSL